MKFALHVHLENQISGSIHLVPITEHGASFLYNLNHKKFLQNLIICYNKFESSQSQNCETNLCAKKPTISVS